MTPAHLVDAAGGGLVQAVGPPDLVTQPQCVEAPHLRGVVRTVCNVCCNNCVAAPPLTAKFSPSGLSATAVMG